MSVVLLLYIVHLSCYSVEFRFVWEIVVQIGTQPHAGSSRMARPPFPVSGHGRIYMIRKNYTRVAFGTADASRNDNSYRIMQ